MNTTTRKVVTAILNDRSLYSNGILYETTFKKEYKARLGNRLAVKERFIGTFSREESKAVEEKLLKSPRGTWAIIDLSYPGGTAYRGLMSDGKGELGGGKYDSYDTPPSFNAIADRMIGYEGYCFRKEVERDLEVAANDAAAARFSIGQIFKNVRFAGENPFSTIIVSAIAGGEIIFDAIRRGSPKRYKFSSPAAIFEMRVAA